MIRSRLRRPTWRGWFSIVLVAFVVATIIAWAIDYATLHDQIARGATIQDVNVGRLDKAELDKALTKANGIYGRGSVEFVINGKITRIQAADIGLRLDEESTLAQARKIGRNDPALLKPVYWAASLVVPRRAPIKIRLDRTKLVTALASLPGQLPVTEPRLIGSGATVGITPGKPGYGFDPKDVATRIARDAREGDLPIRVTLRARTQTPTVSDEHMRLLAAKAFQMTTAPLQLVTPQKQMTAIPAQLRSWISSRINPVTGEPRIVIDPVKSKRAIEQQIGGIQDIPVNAAFTVNESTVELIPQVNGTRCCRSDTGSVVLGALEQQLPSVDVPLRAVEPEFTTKKARALGITTLLGTNADLPQEFTTTTTTTPVTTIPPPEVPTEPPVPAPPPPPPPPPPVPHVSPVFVPGQSIIPLPNDGNVRANVEKSITQLRGRIVLTGATLSLNQVLGAPSPANGFVAARADTPDGPSMVSGSGTDLVAAALFGAAYQGGMDIPSSQRHSVVVPGVPIGMEATLGWTQPDLVIRNTSKHGVLIWVDLIPAGVRVQLFSTPWTSSVSTARTAAYQGPGDHCLAVSLTRTRALLDGTTNVDKFLANYAPTPVSREDPVRTNCPS